MNIKDSPAWKTLIRFTSAEDRRPITHTLRDLRKVASVNQAVVKWRKFDPFRNPDFIHVEVDREDNTPSLREYVVAINSGEQVVGVAVPEIEYPSPTRRLPLPIDAIKRVVFAASKPPALMPLYDGIFVDYRNGRVIATDSEQVCSVPIQQQDLDSLWIPYSVAKALPAGEYRCYMCADKSVWITGGTVSVIYHYASHPTPPVRVLDTPRKGALIICSKKVLLSALKKMDNGDGAKVWIEFETGLCWNPEICNDQQSYDVNGEPLGVESLPILHKIGVASNPSQVEGNATAFVSVRKLLAAVRACREGDGVRLESGGESLLTLRSGAVETHIGQLRR